MVGACAGRGVSVAAWCHLEMSVCRSMGLGVLLAGCGVGVLGAPPAGSRAEQAAMSRRQLQVDDRIHTVRRCSIRRDMA